MVSLSITLFKRLRDEYPTWEALKTYLTSDAAGNFNVRDCEGTSFAIIRYKKGETNLSLLDGAHWFRSVVWDKEKHIPVCVSPRKACEGPPPSNTDLTFEEFYDGVMINAFSINGSNTIHLTTRSQYDATGSFYSKKSFKTLFEEANLNLTAYLTPSAGLHAVFLSTVLQHPENRIVANVAAPAVYIVESGTVEPDGTVTMYTFTKSVSVKFGSEKEAYDLIRTEAIQRGWRWQGYIFRDTLGNRWRIRSSTYSYLRGLRGNDAKAIDRFLRLRAAGEISEYLKHYGEERTVFWDFETALRKRTRQIYDSYVSVHKSHEKTLAELPQPDKTVVFKLHAHYLAHLREQKKPLKIQDTIHLINSLPLWEQALLLSSKPSEQPSTC